MTTDNFCFYLQNRLIQTSQTGGQQYSDTSPLSIPWLHTTKNAASGILVQVYYWVGKSKTQNIKTKLKQKVFTKVIKMPSKEAWVW
jgi:hypothetical protein